MKIIIALIVIVISATGFSFATHSTVNSIGSTSTFKNPVPVCTTGITFSVGKASVNKTSVSGVDRTLCPTAIKLYFNAFDSSGTVLSSGSVTLTSSSTYNNVALTPNLDTNKLSSWGAYIA